MSTSVAIPVLPATRPLPSARLTWRAFAFAGTAVAALGFAVTRLPRHAAAETVVSAPQARGVALTAAKLERNAGELLLPAQLLPYEQTQLFARVDGYVAKWHADRGARVKAGQLLAEIDAPELDQQVRQSEAALDQGRAFLTQTKADLEQAKADEESARAQVTLAEAERTYAGREYARQGRLVRSGASTQNEYDGATRNHDVSQARLTAAHADSSAKEKTVASRAAAVGTQEATVRGLEANVRRLKELQNFKRIVAPFDGTVTRREAEVGALVAAASGRPLFHVQNSATLRVVVDVPQSQANEARRAATGEVIVPESPDRPLPATVARTANALDPVTRTLRVELELPNPERAILAGTYAQVRLRVAARPTVIVPANALRYSPAGVEVVAVEGERAAVKPVKLGRDFGRTVEVLTGLTGSEQLVANPTDDVQPGEVLRVR